MSFSTLSLPRHSRKEISMLGLALFAYQCWIIVYGAVYGDDA